MAQRARIQGRKSVVLYSDGSLDHAGKADVSIAFGVVVKDSNNQYPTAASGRVEGLASSTKAELAGLFAAILVSPRNTPTIVYIDNSTVVPQFKALVEERDRCTERQRVRSSYATWWAAVHHAFVQQGRSVKVAWIKGHAGDSGNEASDKAAKEGHLSELWSLKEDEHNDLLCHAKINDTIVEDDMRRVLKRQSVIRNNTVWTKQNRTATYIPDWQTVDWKATLSIVHDGQTPRSLFTSPAD
ncbi:hypothetical protein BGZ54_004377, partial [Gamsiella multidivaricata]